MPLNTQAKRASRQSQSETSAKPIVRLRLMALELHIKVFSVAQKKVTQKCLGQYLRPASNFGSCGSSRRRSCKRPSGAQRPK
eukprot:6267562-Amphidinium_carterae.1